MKKLQILIIAILGISLSGCFEIIEDVSFNSDGSGTFKLVLNLSQSKSQISKIMSQDSINGQKIPSEADIKNKLSQAVSEMKAQKGISNLVYSTDFENYILKASFDFSNAAALNLAVGNLIKAQDPKAVSDPVNYSWENKTATRTFKSSLLSEAKKNKEKVTKYLGGFENAKLTSIFRFQNEINQTTNQKGKVSSNKKNYFLQSSINNILDNESFQKIQINIK